MMRVRTALEHPLLIVGSELRLCSSGEAEAANSRIGELEAEGQEKAELVARLEEDLLAAKPSGKSAPPAANGASEAAGAAALRRTAWESCTLRHYLCVEEAGAGLSPLAAGCVSLRGGAESDEEDESRERTMVSVLCSQRDRFRKRVSELEEELSQVDPHLLVSLLRNPSLFGAWRRSASSTPSALNTAHPFGV